MHTITPDLVEKNILSELYLGQGLKMQETAVRMGLGTSKQTVMRRVRMYGLPARKGLWQNGSGVHPNTGKKFSMETRKRISAAHIGKVVPLGENAHAWKGGRWTDVYGYVRVYARGHHKAIHGPYVREHVLVAEKKYGRPLVNGEHVHHINGIKNDNRPENLEVLSHAEHSRRHREELKTVIRHTVGILGRIC